MSTLRAFAVGSEARMPGDPATLANGGLCVMQSMAISRIEDDTGKVLETPRVHYLVGVPDQVFFSDFGPELEPTSASVFTDLIYI